MYYEEDAPRSARSVGYGSPRDDRFYTPRTVARSNSNSNSEEWVTPRFETPRFGNNGYNSQSDNEFQTPRTYEERKLDRKEIYPTLLKRASINNDSPRVYDGSPYAAQGKGASQREYGSKELGHKGAGPYPPNYAPSYLNQAQAQSKQIEEEDEHDEEYISLDLAAAGLSEKDVEDVFSYARHGRCEEIERLFAKGLPVDVRNDHGNTVLIVACQNGNKRVAKAVLRRGANINARNLRGNTPLHYCYHYGYGDSLGQYLISKGADADARNNAGKSVDQGI
uniref:Uncharacterized protein n=1 Tax=Spumella elongata TaxID=89044 RepID=A0A7S3HME0_9STRA|mmetsp:Transcript_59481/g.104642  ORF Transcript_59481/g.104642 Transcript_59481/m.104642 type:complete len:280 (+) Transcript_59481:106-945(+)|eukprot:CAMPEP_0184986832 /NCGR_PEP_ID=MMETSP1098-20130426/18099_1 /TAXON_ID=89044 /ORGANISM="Spumella elongata, Strain CCAP 955/1" /LENGTH=279 /DNA_ID=CAMNT_0027511201 /DNA_START=106 /DNA_END=945 /DNA_ORIENTATION=+